MPSAPEQVVDVAAVRLPQDGLQLFAIDAGHAIWTRWKVSGEFGADWTGWMQFPGLARRINSGRLPGDVPQLWAIGVGDQGLYTSWKVSDQPGAGCTDWFTFDGGAYPSIYPLGLDSFRILNVRSRFNDTVHVSMSVAVSGRPSVAVTRRIGKIDEGHCGADLHVDGVQVSADETAVFTYAIVNNGHSDPGAVKDALAKSLSMLADKGVQAAADLSLPSWTA